MKQRLLAAALVVVVALGTGACSDRQLTATDSATTPTATPSASTEAQDPNAAFCQAFTSMIELTFQMIEPALVLEHSTDPAEIEQAWQDILRLANQGAALSQEAIGQTTDPTQTAATKVLKIQFDYIAAAATARDKVFLDALPEPGQDEPFAMCGL